MPDLAGRYKDQRPRLVLQDESDKAKKTYSSGAWYFLAPAVIVLFFVGIFPLLFAVWNSLHQFILAESPFAGKHFGSLAAFRRAV